MVSYVKDKRCIALAKVLVPLLERSSPEGAGGHGGRFQLILTSKETDDLGGKDLIRAALRKAARELGWTVSTYGFDRRSAGEVLLGIEDTRTIPAPYDDVVEQERLEQDHAVVNRLPGALPAGGRLPVLKSTPVMQTKEFRAALSHHGLPA